MNRISTQRVLLGLVLAVGLAAPLSAKEPVEAFLSGLRARGYFDTARDYLESLQKNPNVDAATKARIPYELGRILVDDSKDELVTPVRLKQLEEAVAHFNDFIKQSPKHELAPMARIQLGTVLVERARAVLDRANRPNNTKKAEDLKAAQGLFKEARAAFEAVVKDYDAKLKTYPKLVDKKERKLREEKNAVREVLIEASFYAANTIYMEADAYTGKERNALLTEAAARFHQVYNDYRIVLAGLFAGMWEGRSYQALGDVRRAVALYMELLVLPDDGEEAFRKLKAKVLHLAMECWNDAKENKPEESEQRGEAWLKQARPDEEDSPDGLAIRFRLAQAKHLRIQKLKASAKDGKLGTKEQAEISRLEFDIAKLTRIVSQKQGEFRKQAGDLLAMYRAVKTGEPQNFKDAFERAKEAAQKFEKADAELRGAKTSPESEKLAKNRLIALGDAIRYFRLALELKEKEKGHDPKEILENVNVIRYYLSFMYYKQGMYEEAAVVGEMLAENYPQFAGSQQSGWIALAAWVTLYNAADARFGRKFESDQLYRVASLLARKWPDSEKADEAWMILADIAIREGDMERAKGYLEKIKKESPRRGEADIKLGNTLWSLYLRGLRLESKPPDHDKLLPAAENYLKSGTEALRKQVSPDKPVSSTLLGGELSLAQIHINRGGAGGAKQAIAVLTQKEGLLSLHEAGNNPAVLPSYPEECYRVLLWAYVASGDIKQATQALDKLKSLSKDTKVLMSMFVKLGQEIGLRLKTAAPAEKANMVSAFDAFLQKILEDRKNLDYNYLHWVAETYVGLAEGVGKSAAGQQYYKQAVSLYEQMKETKLPERQKAAEALKAATARKADPEEIKRLQEELKAIDDTVDAIDARRGRCYRGAGEYQKSIEVFIELLTKKENLVAAQKEVCFTYMDQARSTDPKFFINSRAGLLVKGRKVVWGWNGMSTKLASFVRQPGQERLREEFFEARYWLSASFLEHAKREKNQKERAKLLDFCNRSISTFYFLYSAELKSSVWHKSFEDVTVNLQKELGKPPQGLREYDRELEKRKIAPPAGKQAGTAPPAAGLAHSLEIDAPEADSKSESKPVNSAASAQAATAPTTDGARVPIWIWGVILVGVVTVTIVVLRGNKGAKKRSR